MKKNRLTGRSISTKSQDNPQGNKQIQKGHQECLSQQSSFEQKKNKLQDETQEFMYNQSSKFSSVSRSLVLGMLGTIWVITYTDHIIDIPNNWLLHSLFVCLFFLLIDIIHYFWDSMSYHHELFKLDDYTSHEELDHEHEKRMDAISNRSHYFIIIKFIILLIGAAFFVIGIIDKIHNLYRLI